MNEPSRMNERPLAAPIAAGHGPVIVMRGIVKAYSGVLANDKIDLVVREGEIHGLVGENGAGKSTLMNVLAGVVRPDEGEITVLGEDVRFRTAADAIRAGIGMVHQHFMLVPSLSVLDNLILGFEPVRFGGLLRRGEARARLLALMERHGFAFDLDAPVSALPVAQQQQVEIMKCLFQDSRILIFDEPTAVLAPQESDALLATMRELAEAGRTILFITHKLREVMAVTDKVTVLRDGRVTGVTDTANTSERELARLMVGRDVELPTRRSTSAGREARPILELESLITSSLASSSALKTVVGPIDLTVRAGEIVGVAAISGNGEAELVEAVAGLRPVIGGYVKVAGKDLTRGGPALRAKAGLGYIPQDRRGRGAAPDQSVLHTAIARKYTSKGFQRGGWRLEKPARELAMSIVENHDVRTPGLNAKGVTLSGGNLQKLVVGRELANEPLVLVAEDPTQGVDIGSIEAIRRELLSTAERGCGVLLVSKDLSEVLALSDRVVVLHGGRVAGEVLPGPGAEETIGLMMTGAAQ